VAVRIRRPSEHAELLERLTEGSGNPFATYYEVLAFSAALGYARGTRVPFEKSDESIRWELFSGIGGANELVLMLAAAEVDDREVMGAEAENERFRIFEEYANGGLHELSKAHDAHPEKTAREVVLDLVISEQKQPEADLDFNSIVEGLD
jgi:dnd system-associated protein 4